MSKLQESALWYARRGWPVLPCNGKVPLIEHGWQDATTAQATIAAWWRRWPNANVAIATGPAGLVVVDVDAKGDAPGLDSWADLRRELGLDGETVTCETPTGGLHVYYRANGQPIGCSAGKLGPGLDVRAQGGYVIAPPSVHPAGGEYGWALGCGPHERELQDLPTSLAERLAEPKPAPAEPLGERIAQGRRNATLASLAGTMRRRGMSQAAIEAALLAENAARCAPPLPEGEVRAIAASVARYEPEGRQSKEGGYSMADLLDAELPEPVWVVPDLLPAGLSLLAGRPKQGKSFLALQLAVAFGTGGRFLDRPVPRGRALYVALEDSPRRLQGRLRGMRAPADAAVYFEFAWPALNAEGLELLDQRVVADGLRLVVIDTLARAVGGRLDWDDLGSVTAMLGGLQELALARDVCILAIDHHRKPGLVADVVDDVMGSTGKSAVADTIWGLYRQRGDRGAKLAVTGRDVGECELGIRFDGLTLTWQVDETAEGVRYGTVQAEILDALAELGGEATTQDLADALDIPKGNVSRELSELVAKGAVVKCERRGHTIPYKLARTPSDNPDNLDNLTRLQGSLGQGYQGYQGYHGVQDPESAFADF